MQHQKSPWYRRETRPPRGSQALHSSMSRIISMIRGTKNLAHGWFSKASTNDVFWSSNLAMSHTCFEGMDFHDTCSECMAFYFITTILILSDPHDDTTYPFMRYLEGNSWDTLRGRELSEDHKEKIRDAEDQQWTMHTMNARLWVIKEWMHGFLCALTVYNDFLWERMGLECPFSYMTVNYDTNLVNWGSSVLLQEGGWLDTSKNLEVQYKERKMGMVASKKLKDFFPISVKMSMSSYLPSSVIMASCRFEASITFVASVRPPIPVSMTDMSTFSSAKYLQYFETPVFST